MRRRDRNRANAPPVPVIADFIRNANQKFGFVPDQPQNELEFKRAYAKAAAAAGLTRDQIVGVYAFETGGNGTYDTQAGVSAKRPNAISPAVGYNQLLSTNSVVDAGRAWRPYSRRAARKRKKRCSGDAKRAMDAQDRSGQTHDRLRAFGAAALERL